MSVDSINALNKWFVLNKLTLNLSKTCYMTFPSKNFGHVDIKVNNQSVSNVSNCKYLGIMLDDDLKWSEHIDNIFCKVIKFIGIFYKLRGKLPQYILKLIYFAFVHPHILYGIELYANTSSNYLDKLIKLNNKLLRILQNRPITYPTSELYAGYNTLPIPKLHKQQLLLFVHKYIYHPELLPDVFVKSNYFVLNEHIHSYNTRFKSDIHLFSHNTSLGQRSTQFKAACLWNSLPATLKEISSLSFFKRSVKTYLSQSYI